MPLSIVGRKETEDDAGFALYISARLQQDEIGKACQENEIVLAVGKHLYDGKKPVAKLKLPCGRLSWLPVSFLLHVKYTLSYRIVSSQKQRDIRQPVMRDMCQLASLIHEFKRKAESDGATATSHDLLPQAMAY